MKSTLEKVSNLQRRLNIEIPAEIVGATFAKLLKDIQKEAHIKGFRPGKAPLEKIRSLYLHRVQQDVVQELVQKHYSKALKEHALEPISYPDFEFDAPAEGKDFSFSANFEIRPEVQLKKYEGLDVEKEKWAFDENRVSQVIDNIRASRATLVDVLEDRPAQLADIAVIDFDGFVDGQPLAGGKGADHHLELGTKQFIDGFEDGIIGMKPGGSKTLHLKFPSPYHAKELEGKPVEFNVTLKKLKRKELPELTEEFVKTLGGSESLESLKKTIRDDLESSEKKRIEQDLKNRLLRKLVQANPVEVPASLLHDQKQALIEDTKKRMLEQGMGEEEFEDYKKKWDKDFDGTAAEMIQAGFIVDAIAKKHDLHWTDEDIEKKVEEYSKQTGLEISRIREFYARPEQHQRLTYMITEEKVMGFLLSKAQLKEVDKAKLKDLVN